MPQQQPDHDEFDTARLSRLAEDLARLADARIEIPRHVDEAVMGEARRVLTAARRTRGKLRRAAAWAAAAASLAIVAWVGWMIVPTSAPLSKMATTVTAVAEDFDGNGSVDILDAFGGNTDPLTERLG